MSFIKRSSVVLGGVLLIGVLAACNPPPPPAAEFLAVTSTADTVDVAPGDGLCADAGGACTLRAAVMEANANIDVTEINLMGGETYTLTIPGDDEDAAATGDLDLLAGTYLRPEAGTGLATIDAAFIDRVFDVHADATHWFKDVVLTGGLASESGGGVLGRAGVVRIDTSRVTGNLATHSGGGVAGIGSKLALTDVTVDGNSAGEHGGGIASVTDARLTQVTVSDNDSGFNAAEIWVGNGPLVLKASTVVGDSTALDLAAGTATLERSVLGSPNGCVMGPGFSVTSTGGNIAPDATCALTGPVDQPTTDADLGPLGDHGGTLPTRVPSIGSPAIDAIPLDVAGCTSKVGKDQRGVARPVGNGCDAGAVETQAGEPTGADCGPPHNLIPGADLEGCDLSGLDLSGRFLDGADLTDADLTGADLTDVWGVDLVLDGTDLRGADLTRTDLTGATGQPRLGGDTTFADTICPGGTTSSAPCADWALGLVVDHGGDDLDSDPGDGICQDAGGAAGACSLRAAISETNAAPTIDVIAIDGSVGTVSLSRPGIAEDANETGDLDITDAVTLSGAGATIDAAGLDRVLHVHPAGDLTLVDATVTGGSLTGSGYPVDAGGAALVQTGRLQVVTSTITGNAALWGGGIEANGATVSIDRSTLSGNTASTGGSAIDNFASIVTIANSTVSGNDTAGSGAVYIDGSTTITASTISANSGGGIHNGSVPAIVAGSVVADQTTGADCSGTAATSLGHNLESATTCGFAGTGDLQSTTSDLGPLAANGGPTWTHLPALTSAAVDLVPLGQSGLCDGTVATDQRGDARPQANGCDAGSVEVDGGLIVGIDCGPPHNLVPGADLHDCDLSGEDLSGLDLTGVNLEGANLTGANLTGVTLTDASISGVDLTGTTMAGIRTGGMIGFSAARPPGWYHGGGHLVGPGADLTGAVLTNIHWNLPNLEGTILAGANITGAISGSVTGTPASLPTNWSLIDGYLIGPGANLSNADLAGFDLSGQWLQYADLTTADLSGADLTNTSIWSATLTGANFGAANLHRVFSGSLTTSPAALPPDFAVRAGHLIGPGVNLNARDLSNADLSGAVLSGAVLQGTNFDGANIAGADLSGVAAESASFVDATLDDATVSSASLWGADLTDASVRNADLNASNLTNAVLVRTDFAFADLNWTTIIDANVQDARFETVEMTYIRSKGLIGAPIALDSSWQFHRGHLVGFGARLGNANLSGLSLRNVVLQDAYLNAVNFTGSDLQGARSGGVTGTAIMPTGWTQVNGYLVGDGAALHGADFDGVDVQGVSFAGALMSGASFTGANAAGADFTGATLITATFASSDVTNADFYDADLYQATGPGNGTGALANYNVQTRCSHGGNPHVPDFTCSGFDGW